MSKAFYASPSLSPDVVPCDDGHYSKGYLLSSDKKESEGDVMEALVVVELLVVGKKAKDDSS